MAQPQAATAGATPAQAQPQAATAEVTEAQAQPQPKKRADAVFEGGGVKGIGLVGALRAFEDEGFAWQNVAGTSAGALTATLVAVGYSAAELKRIMDEEVEFSKFRDPTLVGRIPLAGKWLSLLVHKGMYKGDYFFNQIRSLLQEKTGEKRLRFGDLVIPKEADDSDEDYERRYKYKLQVVATDITGKLLLELPGDIAKLGGDPDKLEVAQAVRMSMSIPYFFKPVKYKARGHKKHWIVDGGVLSNFPIDIFDCPEGREPAWPTIGVPAVGAGVRQSWPREHSGRHHHEHGAGGDGAERP